ncbi:MAG TPA: arginine--tRNA ligase [Actinomycetota bacterium]|nr:arginine--tRNA ligase [Actinomycetota bacterium]
MITDQLRALVEHALEKALQAGVIDIETPTTIQLERPRRSEHGDWSTNVALGAAAGKGDPRAVAQKLAEFIGESPLLASVEVAGPGFLNFRLAPAWLHDVVTRAVTSDDFGRSDLGEGRKINVEYVSANPTGPINVVSGRYAAVGDTISALLEATGHEVVRECYLNDAGRQVLLFGYSIAARYLQLHGVESDVPEDGYQGDYVMDIARTIKDENAGAFMEMDELERAQRFLAIGLESMIQQMKASLERFGTTFDVWFNETGLHSSGRVEAAVHALGEKGMTELRDGALWFRSSELGDDKDRVLRRSSGEATYLAADAAYLVEKFERGFDHLIYIWGSDHHGTVARLLAAAEALDLGRERVEVLLGQVVTLVSKGETVKSSKRAGQIVELDTLVDEVGADAARYTFLTRSLDVPLEFDIELASQQAPENPVYYVQYAHARICSILRKAQGEGLGVEVGGGVDVGSAVQVGAGGHESGEARAAEGGRVDLSILVHPSEEALMRKLASFEEIVPEAAAARSPQKICRFVEELASTFSGFYRDCKVVSDDAALTAARIELCVATRNVIRIGLRLLGVNAPQTM